MFLFDGDRKIGGGMGECDIFFLRNNNKKKSGQQRCDAFFQKSGASAQKPPCNLRSKMPRYNVTITAIHSIFSYFFLLLLLVEEDVARAPRLMALIVFASSTTAANGL